jgi:hypothetical protein
MPKEKLVVLADQKVAALMANLFAPTTRMRSIFLKPEVTRILISSAIGLRVQFDQYKEAFIDDARTNCGTLFSPTGWNARGAHPGRGKIIDATDIRFDAVIPDEEMNPDREGETCTCTAPRISRKARSALPDRFREIGRQRSCSSADCAATSRSAAVC